ncbi:MAG TPA: substrate-binding domain-containing protein [Chloroflexota bacterium]
MQGKRSGHDRAALRYRAILPLLSRRELSNRLAEERGRQFGVSGRTIRRWLDRYRAGGVAALAERPRPGRPRRLTDGALAALVRHAYLQPSRPSVAQVHRTVVERCRADGQPAPSYWTIWRYCIALPPDEVCLAREGYGAYVARFGRPPGSEGVRPAARSPRLRRRRRIAVVVPETCSFWQQVREGVSLARAALDPHGSDVDWVVAADRLDGRAVAATLERVVREGYDAVGVAAITDAVGDAIWRVARRGVPIATLVADTSYGADTGALFYHGLDNARAGALAGRLLVERVAGPGQVAVLTGSRDVPSQDARRVHFERYVREHGQLEVVGPFENWDSEEATREIVRALLRSLPALRAIYVTTALGYTAARAVEEAGLGSKVVVVGYDLLPPTVRCLQRSLLLAAIDQNAAAQGYQAVVQLHNTLMTGRAPAAYHHFVPGELVDRRSVDQALRRGRLRLRAELAPGESPLGPPPTAD